MFCSECCSFAELCWNSLGIRLWCALVMLLNRHLNAEGFCTHHMWCSCRQSHASPDLLLSFQSRACDCFILHMHHCRCASREQYSGHHGSATACHASLWLATPMLANHLWCLAWPSATSLHVTGTCTVAPVVKQGRSTCRGQFSTCWLQHGRHASCVHTGFLIVSKQHCHAMQMLVFHDSSLQRSCFAQSIHTLCRLFETLDTTTRRVMLPSGRAAVLIDTVGFISDLPPQLIKAFRVCNLAVVYDSQLLIPDLLICWLNAPW